MQIREDPNCVRTDGRQYATVMTAHVLQIINIFLHFLLAFSWGREVVLSEQYIRINESRIDARARAKDNSCSPYDAPSTGRF